MTFQTRTSPSITATIAGNPVAIDSISFTDGIAPEVGNATLHILLGKRLVNGSIITTDPTAINPRDLVIITLGSTSWRGYVGTTQEDGEPSENGALGGRGLTVQAYGIGADMDRAYLASCRRISHLTGNAISCPFDQNFNDNNRPNMSPSTYLVGSAHVNIFSDYQLSALKWNQLAAVKFILALGAADLGIPVIGVVGDTSCLTLELFWSVRGMSVWGALSRVLGQRGNCAWNIRWNGSSWELHVSAVPGNGGGSLDLTGPFIRDFSITRDGRATLGSAVVQGSRKIYCMTLLGYGGTGGTIKQNWTEGDEDRWSDGHDDNQAVFHEFILDGSTQLPDGTSLANARPLSSVPFVVNQGVISGGVGFSGSPFLFMYKKIESGPPEVWRWVDITHECSVSIRGNVVTIGGGSWRDHYFEMRRDSGRFSLTFAVESMNRLTVTKTGGDGTVRGVYETQGDRIIMPELTYIGINPQGSIINGSATLWDDTQRITDEVNAWWEHVKQDRVTVTWSDRACEPIYSPGDRISTAVVPLTQGVNRTDTLALAVVSRRTVQWTPLGVVTSYSSDPLPVSMSGISGGA